MWRNTINNSKNGTASTKVVIPALGNNDDDDWETDPDFVNDMSEEQQRWGGARDTGALDMDKFREEIVKEADEATKKNKSEFSRGYGGKFGIESEERDGAETNKNVEK